MVSIASLSSICKLYIENTEVVCYSISVSGDDTHNKKQNHTTEYLQQWGMTPMKNIIVVDENGNEYEATYPKRAKGLVKNGRARFIDEHTICLACPPDTKLEDKTMSENKATIQNENIPNAEAFTTTEKPLTAREIFDNITELQNQMTKNPYNAMSSLEGSIDSVCGTDESEDKGTQIQEVCNVFLKREQTFYRMLALYEKMYNDVTAGEKAKRQKR